MDRVVVVARLKADARDRAAELIAQGPPFDAGEIGLARHGVYLSEREVMFVFEGDDAERVVAAVVNDPVQSAGFGAWAPLLEETPRLAHEVFFWNRG